MPPEGYVVGVEWLRLIACISIVAFHINVPGALVALGGLHVFTGLTAAFAVRSAPTHSLSQSAKRRVASLVIPWLFWCVFYALYRAIDGVRHGKDPVPWLTPTAWLIGTNFHLWFLPFALFVALALHLVSSRRGRDTWLGWLVATPAATAAACALEKVSLPPPFNQWSSVLPAVTLGACLGHLQPSVPETFRKLFVIAGVLLCTFGTAIALGYSLTALPLLVGLVPVVVAWGTPRTTNATLFAWSGLAFGVYLVHPFIGRVLIKPLSAHPWLHFAVTAAVSLLLVAGIRRTPLRRFT